MLARREYSLLQAKRKLLLKGFPADSVSNILFVYEEKGFLSNERYAFARAYDLSQKGYGSYYVQQKLKQEGVELPCDEIDWKSAYKIALRKAGKREGLALRQYLFRRGFKHEKIDTID